MQFDLKDILAALCVLVLGAALFACSVEREAGIQLEINSGEMEELEDRPLPEFDQEYDRVVIGNTEYSVGWFGDHQGCVGLYYQEAAYGCGGVWYRAGDQEVYHISGVYAEESEISGLLDETPLFLMRHQGYTHVHHRNRRSVSSESLEMTADEGWYFLIKPEGLLNVMSDTGAVLFTYDYGKRFRYESDKPGTFYWTLNDLEAYQRDCKAVEVQRSLGPEGKIDGYRAVCDGYYFKVGLVPDGTGLRGYAY